MKISEIRSKLFSSPDRFQDLETGEIFDSIKQLLRERMRVKGSVNGTFKRVWAVWKRRRDW
jgi:hypothetical protein